MGDSAGVSGGDTIPIGPVASWRPLRKPWELLTREDPPGRPDDPWCEPDRGPGQRGRAVSPQTDQASARPDRPSAGRARAWSRLCTPRRLPTDRTRRPTPGGQRSKTGCKNSSRVRCATPPPRVARRCTSSWSASSSRTRQESCPALSDGSSYPLVHIAEPGVGSYQKLVLENASSVGRAAGVALPDRVHLYVSHLRRLGLVESGPEDHSLKDEYDILLTEPKLRETIASIGKGASGCRESSAGRSGSPISGASCGRQRARRRTSVPTNPRPHG